MRARLLPAAEERRWDDWLRGIEGANARQTSIYRKALSLYGHNSEILVVEGSDRIEAGALLGIKGLGLFGRASVHVSGGVALAETSDPAALKDLLHAILDRCAEHRAASVEVSLRIPRAVGDRANGSADLLAETVAAAGFEPCRPLETYYVDLGRSSDEALLESFGKTPRRHVRKALREGLSIERTKNPADFVAFGEAHRRMSLRKGLDSLPPDFPEQVLLPLVEGGHAELFVARFRDIARNYLLAGCTRLPIYLWGALDEAARDPECPQTGQALHYGAMRHFKALGKPYYDFGGTPGRVPEPDHPNFSVWKFKHEFGVLYVPFLGFWKYDLMPASAAFLKLARWAVAIRKRIVP